MNNKIQNSNNKKYDKEAKETKLWLRILSRVNPETRDKCRKFWREAQELTLIFSSILKK
jgi:hypothetical protein